MSDKDTLVAIRESFEIEDRADLMAAGCRFGEASRLMKQVNKIREGVFGKLDPNELRERARAKEQGK